jgi:hypothetical protein
LYVCTEYLCEIFFYFAIDLFMLTWSLSTRQLGIRSDLVTLVMPVATPIIPLFP